MKVPKKHGPHKPKNTPPCEWARCCWHPSGLGCRDICCWCGRYKP